MIFRLELRKSGKRRLLHHAAEVCHVFPSRLTDPIGAKSSLQDKYYAESSGIPAVCLTHRSRYIAKWNKNAWFITDSHDFRAQPFAGEKHLCSNNAILAIMKIARSLSIVPSQIHASIRTVCVANIDEYIVTNISAGRLFNGNVLILPCFERSYIRKQFGNMKIVIRPFSWDNAGRF